VKEGVPLVFDDTREHWVKNQTDPTRVVLIIDFNARMPLPVNIYTFLRQLRRRPPSGSLGMLRRIMSDMRRLRFSSGSWGTQRCFVK
jgi:hypothetical protein